MIDRWHSWNIYHQDGRYWYRYMPTVSEWGLPLITDERLFWWKQGGFKDNYSIEPIEDEE